MKKRIGLLILVALLFAGFSIGTSATSAPQEIQVEYVSNESVLEATKAYHSEENVALVVAQELSLRAVLQEDVVQKVVDVVNGQGIAPTQIDLEITETAFVATSAVLEKVHALREQGFTISMDDFGVGVSSLNRLKNIYVDTLKIDREFIVDALESERCNVILKRVIDMANDLKIATVAEGIETIEQGALLQHLGCQTGQGYYYARPMPEAQFVDYCKEHAISEAK